MSLQADAVPQSTTLRMTTDDELARSYLYVTQCIMLNGSSPRVSLGATDVLSSASCGPENNGNVLPGSGETFSASPVGGGQAPQVFAGADPTQEPSTSERPALTKKVGTPFEEPGDGSMLPSAEQDAGDLKVVLSSFEEESSALPIKIIGGL